MEKTRIPQVRSFSRVVAERFGTLHDRFLGRSRPMGESRLLWEIGPSGADVRSLRGRLGLDSGYLRECVGALPDFSITSKRDVAFLPRTDSRTGRAG